MSLSIFVAMNRGNFKLKSFEIGNLLFVGGKLCDTEMDPSLNENF